jgi:hypothetical protein
LVPRVGKIIQYLFFCIWFFLLSITTSRAIPCCKHIRASLLFKDWIMDHKICCNLLIDLSVDEYFSCCYLLAIVNNASVNFCFQISIQVLAFCFCLGYLCPYVPLQNHHTILFSTAAALFYIPTGNFHLSISWPELIFCWL